MPPLPFRDDSPGVASALAHAERLASVDAQARKHEAQSRWFAAGSLALAAPFVIVGLLVLTVLLGGGYIGVVTTLFGHFEPHE